MSNGRSEDDSSEYIIQVVSKWLNSSGIQLGAGEGPSPVINVTIDKVILANDKSLIGQIKELVIGDRFENIGPGATVINRASLQNSMNTARVTFDKDIADALIRLAGAVEDSNNLEAIENFNALSEELERPTPRKGLLKSCWNGIISALPEVVNLTEQISKLFT